MKDDKTNVMRILEQKKVPYRALSYDPGDGPLSAAEAAKRLDREPETVFKTLVTTGKSGQHYVFVIPGPEELDLKKAARAVKEKSIEMLPQKELLPLTGYIHGGCSPVGMKKVFPTVVHESAELLETFVVSAGKVAHMVEVKPEDLLKAVRFTCADVTV